MKNMKQLTKVAAILALAVPAIMLVGCFGRDTNTPRLANGEYGLSSVRITTAGEQGGAYTIPYDDGVDFPATLKENTALVAAVNSTVATLRNQKFKVEGNKLTIGAATMEFKIAEKTHAIEFTPPAAGQPGHAEVAALESFDFVAQNNRIVLRKTIEDAIVEFVFAR